MRNHHQRPIRARLLATRNSFPQPSYASGLAHHDRPMSDHLLLATLSGENRLGNERKSNETSEELFFACVSFLLLVFAAFSDIVFRF